MIEYVVRNAKEWQAVYEDITKHSGAVLLLVPPNLLSQMQPPDGYTITPTDAYSLSFRMVIVHPQLPC